MNCAEHQRTISRFVDREIKATACSDLFAHLGACQICREFYDSVVGIGDVMDRVARGDDAIGMDARNLQPFQRGHARSGGQPSYGAGMGMKSKRNVMNTLILAVVMIVIWCVMLSTTISIGPQVGPGFGLAQQPPSSSKPR